MFPNTRCTTTFASAWMLLSATSAFAVNDLSQLPGTSHWHQNSSGLDISTDVGPAESGDLFGSAVASGDFNGDGFDDLAIGAPGENVYFVQMAQANAGAIIIIYGGPSGLTSVASKTMYQGQSQAELGHALAAGDIDGDGYDDLVAGMPLWNDDSVLDAGTIVVAFGSAAGLTFFSGFIDQNSPRIGNNSEAADHFGASLSVGDINDDGYADVAVGAPGESYGNSGQDSGAVYLLYGGNDGLQGANAAHGYQVFVESDSGLAYDSVAGNQYGAAVLLHDVDGDGDDDLVVGVPFSDIQNLDAGLAYMHPSNGTEILRTGTEYFQPSQFGAHTDNDGHDYFFGASLSGGTSSVHGPGPDLQSVLFGAPGYNEGVSLQLLIGRGYLYQSSKTLEHRFIQTQQPPESPQPFDEYGRAVLFADLDGDGLADERVIGAPGEAGGTGMIQLYSDQTGIGFLPLRVGDPGVGGFPSPGERFGEVLARGNFNGRDGDELVIGIRHESISGFADAGMVDVISWDPPDLIFADDFD